MSYTRCHLPKGSHLFFLYQLQLARFQFGKRNLQAFLLLRKFPGPVFHAFFQQYVLFLQRLLLPFIDGLQVQVIKEMTADPVRRIGSLKTRLVFPSGKPLSVTDRAKLEAAAKACPVKQSLHPDVKIPLEFVYPD